MNAVSNEERLKADYFRVLSGTKQGGILSPRISTMYMDGLISLLRRKGVGCHILHVTIQIEIRKTCGVEGIGQITFFVSRNII